MRSPGCSLITSSSFSRIFSLVPPGKFSFYVVVNTKTFLRDTIYHGVSGQYDFLFLTRRFCLSLFFCFELELGLEFPLSVSNILSSSVTVLFTELVLLLVSLFCLKKKFMIGSFSVSSFFKLDVRFFKISGSDGEFSIIYIVFPIFFRRFWNKTNICVHSSTGCFTSLLGVGGRADGVLTLVRKNDDSEDFWFSGKTKVPDSEKGVQWLVSSASVFYVLLFVWFCKNDQPVLWSLWRTCLAINLADFLLITCFRG